MRVFGGMVGFSQDFGEGWGGEVRKCLILCWDVIAELSLLA